MQSQCPSRYEFTSAEPCGRHPPTPETSPLCAPVVPELRASLHLCISVVTARVGASFHLCLQTALLKGPSAKFNALSLDKCSSPAGRNPLADRSYWSFSHLSAMLSIKRPSAFSLLHPGTVASPPRKGGSPAEGTLGAAPRASARPALRPGPAPRPASPCRCSASCRPGV